MSAPSSPRPLAYYGLPDDYSGPEIPTGRVAEWENGLRTGGAPEEYEWWYVDSKMDDGTTLVVGLGTKDVVDAGGPLAPFARVDLDLGDGTRVTRTARADPADCSFATDRCAVRIGACSYEGDLEHLVLHYEDDELEIDLDIESRCEPFKPGTGLACHGPRGEDVLGWIIAVPQASITGSLTYRGDEHVLRGAGYQDHGWGNSPFVELYHHWYWCRAEIGPYATVVTSQVAAAKYAHDTTKAFMLAKDGRIVVRDSGQMRFYHALERLDPDTDKPVSHDLLVVHEDGDEKYLLEFEVERVLLATSFVDMMIEDQALRDAITATGFDGAYHRFTGRATLDHYSRGRLVESFVSDAIWELNYTGHKYLGSI